MWAATSTFCQVSRAGGAGRALRDVRRADAGVVVLEQTARVAEVGCGQILCERAVVLCLVSRVRLCSSVRGEYGLLRRRERVDRSEWGAGLARSVVHRLWRAWQAGGRGRAVSSVAGLVNPENDQSPRESR
jgi:hypothetical protein